MLALELIGLKKFFGKHEIFVTDILKYLTCFYIMLRYVNKI